MRMFFHHLRSLYAIVRINAKAQAVIIFLNMIRLNVFFSPIRLMAFSSMWSGGGFGVILSNWKNSIHSTEVISKSILISLTFLITL